MNFTLGMLVGIAVALPTLWIFDRLLLPHWLRRLDAWAENVSNVSEASAPKRRASAPKRHQRR